MPLSNHLAGVTEVSYLLNHCIPQQCGFLQWLYNGAMQVVPFEQEDLRRAIDIIDKYADLPADFADATLVAVAERLEIRDIVTFDSDFDIYLFGDN